MNRIAYAISQSLISAARIANTADCAQDDEKEFTHDQRVEIARFVDKKVSAGQIASAILLLEAALEEKKKRLA